MVCHFTEQKSASGPYLICCPASVLPNWSAELKRWAPKLKVVEYKGRAEAREEIYYKKVCGWLSWTGLAAASAVCACQKLAYCPHCACYLPSCFSEHSRHAGTVLFRVTVSDLSWLQRLSLDCKLPVEPSICCLVSCRSVGKTLTSC